MATAKPSIQEQSTEDKNIRIAWLEGENLYIDHEALEKIFLRPELQGKKIAIISIAGKMRSGKSFLMNFVLRYLRCHGWENDDWMGNDNCDVSMDELPFAGGTERCTTGICIFDDMFEVPISRNETMMVMLMDTQGLFDHDTPEIVNKSLLTLTTLISSVQIFNSKDNINSQDMNYLKTCIDFAMRTAKSSEEERHQYEGYIKLQNLMFLVRDFPEVEEKDYGLEIGRNYLQNILSSGDGGEELISIRSRIRQSFERVECFVMPHPGLKATKLSFQGRNADLEENFRKYLKLFVEFIASSQILQPKQSSTKVITAREMFNLILACDNMSAMVSVQDMIKINEESFFYSLCQEAVIKYDKLMQENTSNLDGTTVLEEKHENCMSLAVFDLVNSSVFSDVNSHNWKDRYLKHFSSMCNDHFDILQRRHKTELEWRRVRTSTAINSYQFNMQSELLEPLLDSEFEELDKRHRNEVFEAYIDYSDFNDLLEGVTSVHDRLKIDNKHRLEAIDKERRLKERKQKIHEDKVRVQQRTEEMKRKMQEEEKKKILVANLLEESRRMWSEFMKRCRYEKEMYEKEELIFLKLDAKFLEEAGKFMDTKEERVDLRRKLKLIFEGENQRNKLLWNNKKKTINCEIESEAVKIRKEFSEMMVDHHLKEGEIRQKFREIQLKMKKEFTFSGVKSEREIEYSIQLLEQSLSEVMEEVIAKNRKYKREKYEPLTKLFSGFSLFGDD